MKPNALEQPEVRSQRAAIRRAAVMQAIRIARLALQRVTPRSCKWLRLWGRNCDKMKGTLCERSSQLGARSISLGARTTVDRDFRHDIRTVAQSLVRSSGL